MKDEIGGTHPGSRKKYLVTVNSKSKRDLRELALYELDLFQPTAKFSEKGGFGIEGFLTLEQIGRLVDDGYQVLVREESSKLARARSQTIDFKEWIKETQK